MRTISVVLAGAAMLATACASKPAPEVVPGPVPAAPATTPRPAPTAPVVPTNPGPAAGSRADFEAKLGEQTRVFFGYDKYDLDDAARSALQAQAAWLKQYPSTRIQIEGNADERGTREYNIALGYRRAEAVASYLMSLGVDTSRITTISYGKDRPFDGGHTEEAWAKNRNGYTNLLTGASS